MAAQWTGHWFNRGYKGAVPYAVDSLYLTPQPWAVLAGAATPAQAATLADNTTRLLSAPSPIGAASQSASQGYGPVREQPTGKGTTGGVWYALNGPLVWAFAAAATDLAWREYKANTHAAYAQAYPDNWFGVLSGPDAYDSFQAASAGQAAIMDVRLQGTWRAGGCASVAARPAGGRSSPAHPEPALPAAPDKAPANPSACAGRRPLWVPSVGGEPYRWVDDHRVLCDVGANIWLPTLGSRCRPPRHHAEVISLKGDSYRLEDRDLGHVPAAATEES